MAKNITAKIRKTGAVALAVIIAFVGCFCMGIDTDESYGAEGLAIKAGFYGGPYYDVKTYGSGRLSALSDHTVYLYTGVDAGGFMTASYAWGVSMSSLISNAGIDTDSVNFLYFKTSDSRSESIVTYRASSLMGNRASYPNMIKAVDLNNPLKQQTISSSKISNELTSGSKSVPTMIAVGYTGWSREEIVRAAQPKNWVEKEVEEEYEEEEEYQEEEPYVDEQGEQKTRTVTKTRMVKKTRKVTVKEPGERAGFKKYSASELGRPAGFRLTYGQGSILENNVRTSSKNITEIDIQLAGAPNIKVTKKLVTGEEGQMGSKYKITVKVQMPDSYSYLSKSAIKELQKQVLQNLNLSSNDESVLRVKEIDGSKGEYEAELVGKGAASVNYSYSRKEYDGTTSVSDSVELENMEGTGEESGTDEEGTKEEEKAKAGDNDSSKKLGLKKDKEDTKKDEEKLEEENESTTKWVAADKLIQQSNEPLRVGKDGSLKGVGAGAGALFAAGFAGTLLIYRRRL